MNILVYIIVFIIGLGVGYLVFYFRYIDRRLVDDLRDSVGNLQHELTSLHITSKEFEEQNRILKTKVSELLLKNDDLTKITSELYRYYHRIKEWYAKALELADMLKSFDKEFDEKTSIHGDTLLKPSVASWTHETQYTINHESHTHKRF